MTQDSNYIADLNPSLKYESISRKGLRFKEIYSNCQIREIGNALFGEWKINN